MCVPTTQYYMPVCTYIVYLYVLVYKSLLFIYAPSLCAAHRTSHVYRIRTYQMRARCALTQTQKRHTVVTASLARKRRTRRARGSGLCVCAHGSCIQQPTSAQRTRTHTHSIIWSVATVAASAAASPAPPLTVGRARGVRVARLGFALRLFVWTA